jgi:Cft2 family RNA processing exonuclease
MNDMFGIERGRGEVLIRAFSAGPTLEVFLGLRPRLH